MMIISNRKWMEVQKAFWKAAKGDQDSIMTLQLSDPELHDRLESFLANIVNNGESRITT